MSAPHAPRHVEEISSWAAAHGARFDDARRRFILSAALYVIAGEPACDGLCVFGSAALSLLYGLRRVPKDLDFFYLPETELGESAKAELVQTANRALNAGLRKFVPFDATWRPLLASEIKIQLCDDRGLVQGVERVMLDYDPPRAVQAQTFEDVIAMKLLTLWRPLGKALARDQDVYDVADAARVRAISIDPIARQFSLLLDRSARPISEDADVLARFLEQTRLAYQRKHETGEYDIPWESAWQTYDTLREQCRQR